MSARLWLLMLTGIPSVLANVEKTIFLGPEAANIPLQHATLDDLNIDTLTLDRWSIRTHVEAAFPSESLPSGKETWVLLDDLTPGQRYEVRICWAAIQPTSFILDTFELSTAWETPELISSLAAYSASRQPITSSAEEEAKPRVHQARKDGKGGERQASVLLLRILAAAEYYTTNATLMRDVPPVHADIILDPFLLNVMPRSLLPTAGYIVVVAAASYFLARGIIAWIRGVVAAGAAEGPSTADGKTKEKKKKQQ